MEAAAIIERAQRLANRVDVDFDDRCYQFINEALEEFALAHPWSTLHRVITLPCTGDAHLIIPQHVLAVRWMIDETNKYPINPKEGWDREAPDAYVEATVGNAFWWQEIGMVPAIRDGSGPLSIVCSYSEAGVAYVAGTVENTAYSGTANHYSLLDEQVSFAAATGVTLTNRFVEIATFGKSSRTTGELRLFDSTGLLSVIPPREFSAGYRRLRLLYKPSGGTLIRMGVLQKPPQIYQAGQVLPVQVNPNYVIWYVAGCIHKALGQEQRAALCMQKAIEILDKRIRFENNFGDRDWGASPDSDYWTHEDNMAWDSQS